MKFRGQTRISTGMSGPFNTPPPPPPSFDVNNMLGGGGGGVPTWSRGPPTPRKRTDVQVQNIRNFPNRPQKAGDQFSGGRKRTVPICMTNKQGHPAKNRNVQSERRRTETPEGPIMQLSTFDHGTDLPRSKVDKAQHTFLFEVEGKFCR